MRHDTFSGASVPRFRPLLKISLAPTSLAGFSLGALWDPLWVQSVDLGALGRDLGALVCRQGATLFLFLGFMTLSMLLVGFLLCTWH